MLSDMENNYLSCHMHYSKKSCETVGTEAIKHVQKRYDPDDTLMHVLKEVNQHFTISYNRLVNSTVSLARGWYIFQEMARVWMESGSCVKMEKHLAYCLSILVCAVRYIKCGERHNKNDPKTNQTMAMEQNRLVGMNMGTQAFPMMTLSMTICENNLSVYSLVRPS